MTSTGREEATLYRYVCVNVLFGAICIPYLGLFRYVSS